MKPLSHEERMKLLIDNHNEHVSRIMLNFANQFHQLAKEIEFDNQVKDFPKPKEFEE